MQFWLSQLTKDVVELREAEAPGRHSLPGKLDALAAF